VKASQSVSIRVRAINEKGIKATGVIVGLTLYGKALPPGEPTGLTIAGGPGLITLSWTNPSDPDFSHIDIIEYEGMAQPSSPDEGTLVASISGSSLTRGGLAEMQTYWYWIRSVDTSGNTSDWIGPVSGTTTMMSVEDGSITETKIADDAVTTPKLAANAVVASKINVAELSAITANMGTLTAGVAKSTDGKFYIDLTGKYLAVYDENNVLRVKLGYLG
jgi:predicted phage tail protein